MNHPSPDSLPVIEQALLQFDRLQATGHEPTAADFRPQFQGNNLADFVELIYHEFCCLEAGNRSPDHLEFLSRYREFAPQLEKLFEVHFGLSNLGDPETEETDPSARPEFPACGDHIGPFLLVKILGQGMLGKVFLAHQTNLGDRHVAVKVSRSGRSAETDLQAILTHPNIMPVMDQFQSTDEAFNIVVMHYRPGASLDQLLLDSRPPKPRSGRGVPIDIRTTLAQHNPQTPDLPASHNSRPSWPDQVADWGARLADALFYAFQKGVIHGDIKPGNIYIDISLTPSLLDFHLARSWQFLHHKRVMNRQDLGGTLHYLPPERLRLLMGPFTAKKSQLQFSTQHVQAAHRGDLYGLGLVLLELLTGHGPAQVQKCPSDNLAETTTLLCQWREEPSFLNDWPGYRSLPTAWKQLLARLLAPEPALRFETGAELAQSLRELSKQHGAIGHRNPLGRKPIIAALILLASLIWGSLTAISMQRAAYARAVQAYWHMPDYFRNDPSETAEIRLNTRLRQARLQLAPILNQSDQMFQHSRLPWLTKPAQARLDAHIWLAQRLEHLSKALTDRAKATQNEDDTRVATELLQFGIDQYNLPAWRKRYLDLTGHHAKSAPSGSGRSGDGRFPRVFEKYLATLDKPDHSEQTWQELLRLAPDSFGVRYGYAMDLIRRDKGRNAIEQLSAATAIDPTHADALRLLAYCEMDQAQYTKALAHLDQALNQRPDDISALRLQAICRIQTGQRAALVAELARIGEILEERPAQRKLEINELLDENPATNADQTEIFDLKTVEKLAGLIPNDPRVLDLLMHKYAKAGRIFDAIVTIEEIEVLRPGRLEDRINHAILAFSIGQMELTFRNIENILNDESLNIALKKHKSLSIFILDAIRRIEFTNANRALKLMKAFLPRFQDAQVALGESHFLMARLTLETLNESGATESLKHLIQSGQQNETYLRKWYRSDIVIQKYHHLLDEHLYNIFPSIFSSISESK